jgi:hypothetical protein
MSRYSTRQPFTTACSHYACLRPVTLSGNTYQPGDLIPAGAGRQRVMASLWESRKIDVACSAV